MALHIRCRANYYVRNTEKGNTMIIGKKNENVITEENEAMECVCPMMDFIAKLVAIDFDESDAFEYDSPYTVLLCDLIFKLYDREEYKEAMELLAVAFMMADMNDTSENLAIASSGYSEEKGRFFLNRFFAYSSICDTYVLSRQLFASEEAS